MFSEQNLNNQEKEAELLKLVCSKYGVDDGDIKSLVEVERQLIGKQKRRGLTAKIDEVIRRIKYRKVGEDNAADKTDI